MVVSDYYLEETRIDTLRNRDVLVFIPASALKTSKWHSLRVVLHRSAVHGSAQRCAARAFPSWGGLQVAFGIANRFIPFFILAGLAERA